MKLTLKGVFCLGILMPMAGNVLADDDDVAETASNSAGCAKGYACARPDFLPFSQGLNRARDYAGQANLQNLVDLDDWNYVSGIAYNYERTFNSDKFGRYFSPSCSNNVITVGTNAGAGVDIRGEDIGLSPTFEGTLRLEPKIQNYIFEPSLYLGLDRWLEGLYLWTKLPITHTIWTMETCETQTAQGHYRFVAARMDSDAASTDNSDGSRTISSITNAFSGKYTFGDKDVPLQAGRILSNCPFNLTALADIPLHIGYNFFNKDRGYLGLYARVVFPSGTVESNRSIFDPRVGLNRWQLGGGLQGKVRFYENDEGTTQFNAFLDVNVTHAFKNDECRLFDIKTGTQRPTDIKWSRYLLMKQFNESFAYTGRLRNFADVFTVCAESGFSWILDGLVFFDLQFEHWNFDLGYEIKGRGCEDFGTIGGVCDPCTYDSCDDVCSDTTAPTSLFRYGIKGIQNANSTTIEPTASIKLGSTTTQTAAATYTLDPDDAANQIDLDSARRPRAVSHKIFADLGYKWDVGEFKFFDNHGPIFANWGASVEFASDNRALYQWGIWGKWGVAYN